MNNPLPSGGPCDCRFCRPGHALSRVAMTLLLSAPRLTHGMRNHLKLNSTSTLSPLC